MEIPVLDVSGALAEDPVELLRSGRDLRHALTDVGFFFVAGHGVDPHLVGEMYRLAAEFHALPQEAKDAAHVSEGKRGYLPMGHVTSYSSEVDDTDVRRPHLSEAFYVDRDDLGHNQWPDLPGFRETTLRYYEVVERLAFDLLPIFAVALDLPSGYFGPYFEGATSCGLRLAIYPPVADVGEHEWGISAHTDGSFLTLLPANDVEGLSVRPRGSGWIDAPNLPGSFLVNSGDTLRRWTNNVFLSTAHRVGVPQRLRTALPFFYGPRDDTMLTPLPTCVSAQRPPAYEPMTYGEYNLEFLRTNYGNTDLAQTP